MDTNGAALRAEQTAVRVLCVDHRGRVLLLRWSGSDGAAYWEPPGGAIAPGESTLEAAGRELTLNTGLTARAITGKYVLVHRDLAWFGERVTVIEPFYLARVADTPTVDSSRLTPARRTRCAGHTWLWPTKHPPCPTTSNPLTCDP